MHPTSSVRRASRLAAVATVVALAATACASDSSSSDTTVPNTTETTTVDTTTPHTTTPPTTAEPTTVPETTAPATTAPETTTPPATVPATVAGTVPTPSDEELSLFCFDSEQVYIANVVLSGLSEATPAQAEAATASAAFWVRQAVDAAPDGYADQPLAAQGALDELVVIFDANGYDVDAILAGPDGERTTALVTEFNQVMASLADFLSEVCNSQFVVLNSQAEKLAPVIEEAITWPLIVVTNVAGDIRLLVPPEWSDWLGSTGVEEVTFLQASPDNAQFDTDWGVAGVVATVAYVELGLADPETRLVLTSASEDCEAVVSEPYSDPVYAGTLHLFQNCADTTTAAAVLLATDDESQSVEIVLEFQFPDGADRELLDQMLATFAAGA